MQKIIQLKLSESCREFVDNERQKESSSERPHLLASEVRFSAFTYTQLIVKLSFNTLHASTNHKSVYIPTFQNV